MSLCHLEECHDRNPLRYYRGTTVFVVTMKGGGLWSADTVVGEKPMTTNDWYTVEAYGAMHLMKVSSEVALQDGFSGFFSEGLTFRRDVLKEIVLFTCRYEGLKPEKVETLDEYLRRTRLGVS